MDCETCSRPILADPLVGIVYSEVPTEDLLASKDKKISHSLCFLIQSFCFKMTFLNILFYFLLLNKCLRILIQPDILTPLALDKLYGCSLLNHAGFCVYLSKLLAYIFVSLSFNLIDCLKMHVLTYDGNVQIWVWNHMIADLKIFKLKSIIYNSCTYWASSFVFSIHNLINQQLTFHEKKLVLTPVISFLQEMFRAAFIDEVCLKCPRGNIDR